MVHTGGLGAGAIYNGSLTAAVPALAPGSYYVLVQADSLYQVPDPNRANNTLAADRPARRQPAVPDPRQDRHRLVHGRRAGQLLPGHRAGRRVAGRLGRERRVVRRAGALCQPGDACRRRTTTRKRPAIANQPSQTAVVPQVLTAGTYYILAESVSGAAATAGYTLTVTQGSASTISGLSPTSGRQRRQRHGRDRRHQLHADGHRQLDPGRHDRSRPRRSTSSSASQIFATFNLTGAAAGNYTLSVQQGSQSVTAPTPFQVVAASRGHAERQPQRAAVRPLRADRHDRHHLHQPDRQRHRRPAPDDLVHQYQRLLQHAGRSEQLRAVGPGPGGGPERPGGHPAARPERPAHPDPAVRRHGRWRHDPGPGDQIEAGQTIDWASQESALRPSTHSRPRPGTSSWTTCWPWSARRPIPTTPPWPRPRPTSAASARPRPRSATSAGSGRSSSRRPTPRSRPRRLTSAVDASLPTPGSLSLAIDRTFVSTIAGRDTAGIFGLGLGDLLADLA